MIEKFAGETALSSAHRPASANARLWCRWQVASHWSCSSLRCSMLARSAGRAATCLQISDNVGPHHSSGATSSHTFPHTTTTAHCIYSVTVKACMAVTHPASSFPATGSGEMPALWCRPLWPCRAGQHLPRGLLTSDVWRSSSAALQTQSAGGGRQPSKGFGRHEVSGDLQARGTPRQENKPAHLRRQTDEVSAGGIRDPWAALQAESAGDGDCRRLL